MPSAEQDLRALTQMLWRSMVGLRLTNKDQTPSSMSFGQNVAASVEIIGGWAGTLAIVCPVPLARKIAAAMFDTTDEQTSDDLSQDAMGELANILGGGIKGQMPGECHLSLPAVTDATVFLQGLDSQGVVSEVGFECEGYSVTVSLHGSDLSVDGSAPAIAPLGPVIVPRDQNQ